MLTGLQEEINKHTELSGASNKIILKFLNELKTETMIVSEEECLILKGDMLAMLSLDNIVKVVEWKNAKGSNYAKVFYALYETHEHFKTSDLMFRGLMEILYSYNLISESEKNNILKLGERNKSRSEELFSKFLTLEDFE